MRLDCPCDLCGKTRGRDKRPWRHFVDMLGHHHHRCPDHWQVRCLACGRMALAATHHMLTIDGWRIIGGCDADIHLITGVCADTIRGILTAPGRHHPCSTGLRTPRPHGRIV